MLWSRSDDTELLAVSWRWMLQDDTLGKLRPANGVAPARHQQPATLMTQACGTQKTQTDAPSHHAGAPCM